MKGLKRWVSVQLMAQVHSDECCSRSWGCRFHTILTMCSNSSGIAEWQHADSGRSHQLPSIHVLHLLHVADGAKNTLTAFIYENEDNVFIFVLQILGILFFVFVNLFLNAFFIKF